MSTYYAAQLGIALSIVDSNENPEVNSRVIKHHDVVNVIYRVHSRFISTNVNKTIVIEDKETIVCDNVEQVDFKSKKLD